MPSVQKSLRIPDEVAKIIQEQADSSGRDFSGRRARIAGTGLDVWEVIATYKSLNHDDARLRGAYDWLSEPQLRSALGYFRLYSDEIERQILRNEAWSKEKLADRHPSLTQARS